MSTSVNEKQKLKTRDLVTLGVFSVLFFVVTMLVISLCSISVVAYLLGPAIAAIPAGIIWQYMHARVPRPWAMLVPGLLFAIVDLLIGSGWPIALGIAVGAVLSELVSQVGKCRKFWFNALAYGVFNVCFALGMCVPMVWMQDYYTQLMSSNAVNQEFGAQIMNVVDPAALCGIAAAAFVGAIIGSLLARLFLKRHFERAGIV